MLGQRRFCHDGAQAAGARKFRRGDRRVDGENGMLAHEANRTTTTGARRRRHPCLGVLVPNSPLRTAVTALAPEANIAPPSPDPVRDDSGFTTLEGLCDRISRDGLPAHRHIDHVG